ncbi:hypothetical protein ACONUD_10565 [Microbulbifer harenosus]|uniref:DUF4852 domain-containing protein n=1 Tax=Microbulbifer harenosus TaxID=2576840 RepID=A0ABY2UGF0_9GAMM|nr:hypothetical protein [Microbulbifer harenosus]TLM76536.1 hypothetical protein FDY93_12445 [Microbulbifer harenosus]
MKIWFRLLPLAFILFSPFCVGAGFVNEVYSYNPGLVDGKISIFFPAVKQYKDSYLMGGSKNSPNDDHKILLEYYSLLKNGKFAAAANLLSSKDGSRELAKNEISLFSKQRVGFKDLERVSFSEAFKWGIYTIFDVQLIGGGRSVSFFEASICLKDGCHPSTFLMRGGEDVRLFGMLMQARKLSGARLNLTRSRLSKDSDFVAHFLPSGDIYKPGSDQLPIEIYVDAKPLSAKERALYLDTVKSISVNLSDVNFGLEKIDLPFDVNQKLSGFQDFYVRINSLLDKNSEAFYPFSPSAFFNKFKYLDDVEVFGFLAYDDIAYVYLGMDENFEPPLVVYDVGQKVGDASQSPEVADESSSGEQGKLLQVLVFDRRTGNIYLNLNRDITYLLLTENVLIPSYRKFIKGK